MAVFVFDCGGTLMEYAGMPAAWSALYPQGFRAVADAFCLAESSSCLSTCIPAQAKRPLFLFGTGASACRKTCSGN